MRLSWSGESKISCTGLCACGVAGGRGADASRGLLGFSGPGGGVVATLGKKRNKCSEQSVGGNYVGKKVSRAALNNTQIYRTRNFTKLWNCRKCCQTLPYSHSKSDPNSQHPMSLKKLDFFPAFMPRSVQPEHCNSAMRASKALTSTDPPIDPELLDDATGPPPGEAVGE